MLYYDLSDEVEAFSTNKEDATDFPVRLPPHQAHSALVRRVPQEQDDITGVDALITSERGLRIGVKTADCVPILLFDERQKAVAAIHSGWKGTVQNIIAATIGRMREEFATDPADLRAVIGPCIHLEAFEVGDEVYEKFRQMTPLKAQPSSPLWKKMPPMNRLSAEPSDAKSPLRGDLGGSSLGDLGGSVPEHSGWSWHINLPAFCQAQLMACGVLEGRIEVREECTWQQHDRFFSARRLGRQFDRQRIYNCIMLR